MLVKTGRKKLCATSSRALQREMAGKDVDTWRESRAVKGDLR